MTITQHESSQTMRPDYMRTLLAAFGFLLPEPIPALAQELCKRNIYAAEDG